MRVSQLSNAALNWAVAETEYSRMHTEGQTVKGWVWDNHEKGEVTLDYTSNWQAAGEIIDREKIELAWTVTDANGNGYWRAQNVLNDTYGYMGDTPLIAAMRCYVASKLGDTIEVPENLR